MQPIEQPIEEPIGEPVPVDESQRELQPDYSAPTQLYATMREDPNLSTL